MSSQTKTTFIAELKLRSAIIQPLDNITVGKFIDLALRAYSDALPHIKTSAGNSIVDGQSLYDLPADANDVLNVRVSESLNEISFRIEDHGNGKKLKLGSVKSKSYADLLSMSAYIDPTASQSGAVVLSYDSFDIEYFVLQTLDSIAEDQLEAISYYVEYLAYMRKAGELAVIQATSGEETPIIISDTDPSGAESRVEFGKKEDTIKSIKELANSSLKLFQSSLNVGYGVRR